MADAVTELEKGPDQELGLQLPKVNGWKILSLMLSSQLLPVTAATV